jgi:glycosyltransferase involved in cell wall biosynthesis
MRLLYLQQLLVLPGMAGNGRSWAFARRWAQAGLRITLVASTAGHSIEGPFPRRELREGIEIWWVEAEYAQQMSFPRRIRAFFRFMTKAWRLCQRLPRPDALLAYTAPLSVAALGYVLARQWRRPLLIELGDVWPDVPIGMGLIRPPVLAWALRKSAGIIYCAADQIFPFSPGMAEQLRAYGLPQEKICVVLNGAQLPPAPKPKPRARQGPVQLLYSGTIGIANGLDQLLLAFAELERQQKPVQLTLLGSGNDLARVRDLAGRLGLRGLQFLPEASYEEARRQMEAADIGVVCFAPHPVLAANSATKWYDYLAAGLPVVINYGGWQAEWLERWDCGRWAPPGDPAALAARIAELAGDAALRERMAANGLALARAEFDREALADKMLRKMQEVLAQP